MTEPSREARLNRLSFRAWRRGFREADLILGPFSDLHARDLTEAQLDEFERILQVPDQDLFGWIVGREPTPPEFQGEVMAMIQAFRETAHAATPAEVRGS